MIASIQRLERVARAQLERVYEETRRAGGSTIVTVDRRAVDRVRELIALTRSGRRPDRRAPAR